MASQLKLWDLYQSLLQFFTEREREYKEVKRQAFDTGKTQQECHTRVPAVMTVVDPCTIFTSKTAGWEPDVFTVKLLPRVVKHKII